jgi:hypothetical protein
MQIENDFKFSFGPLGGEVTYCPYRWIVAVAPVITVMVVWFAILALIAVFDSVFVDERYSKDFHIIPEPKTQIRIGQNGLQQTFKCV